MESASEPEPLRSDAPRPARPVRKASVRSLRAEDIPAIVGLHHKVMSPRLRAPDQFFADLFLDPPWRDDAIPSLVYEDGDGQVVGFLGVVPRTLALGETSIRAAFTTKFMVDPDARSSMAALQLFRRFMAGPQQLSYSDIVNEQGLSVWQAFGGRIVPIAGLEWHRHLRRAPSQRFQSRLRGVIGAAAKLGYPLLDAAAQKLVPTQRLQRPELVAVEFEPSVVVETMPRLVGRTVLRPVYDEATLRFITRGLDADPDGALQGAILRTAAGDTAGWFLYRLMHGKYAHVVHLAAQRKDMSKALDSLLWHAAKAGATDVFGRLDPLWFSTLSDRKDVSCRFRGYSLVVRTDDDALRETIFRGDLFLTPIEGEEITQFHGERPE